MKFLTHADRLCQLDNLLRNRRTGTASEIAKRLSLSRSRFNALLAEMREIGIDIQWNEELKSYYYKYPERITIQPPILINRPNNH